MSDQNDIWTDPPIAYFDENDKRVGTGPQMVKIISEQAAEISALKSRIDIAGVGLAAQREEIERLRAVVEKLPKTADGVPIVPHTSTHVFRMFDGEVVHGYAYQFDWRDLRKVYSTLEAAQAALAQQSCTECGSTGTVNTFDGKDTASSTAENWPGPCPKCLAAIAQQEDPCSKQ